MCRILYRPLAVGGIAAVALASLAACGGGGDRVDPIPPIPPARPPPTVTPADSGFVEVAGQSGLDREFGIVAPQRSFGEEFASGLAAADYDADGDIDLYVAGGDMEPNHLYQNQGDGTFVDVAQTVGLALQHRGSGPTFADVDGDGDLDLFVGAVDGGRIHLMENRDGSFVDMTTRSGLDVTADNTISATFGDYDLDGDLDLALAHWGNPQRPDTETLWRNDGRGVFESASIESGIAAALIERDPPGARSHVYAELQRHRRGRRSGSPHFRGFRDYPGVPQQRRRHLYAHDRPRRDHRPGRHGCRRRRLRQRRRHGLVRHVHPRGGQLLRQPAVPQSRRRHLRGRDRRSRRRPGRLGLGKLLRGLRQRRRARHLPHQRLEGLDRRRRQRRRLHRRPGTAVHGPGRWHFRASGHGVVADGSGHGPGRGVLRRRARRRHRHRDHEQRGQAPGLLPERSRRRQPLPRHCPRRRRREHAGG